MKTLKKLFVFLPLFFAAIGGMIAGCSKSPQKNTFTVGIQAGYPPYESIDSNGKIVGFDVDLAEKIAGLLDKKLVLKEMDFDCLILSLKQKNIDAIISGMSITPSRLKKIDMVPYSGDQLKKFLLLFWEHIPEGVSSIKDLSEQTVCVQSGTTQAGYLKKFPKVKMKEFENAQELILDIQFGKSAAALFEPIVAKNYIKKNSQLKSIDIKLAEEDNFFGNGIGIKKENAVLKDEIEKAMQLLKENGEIQELEEKWFGGNL